MSLALPSDEDVERALEIRIREKLRKEARPIESCANWIMAVRAGLRRDPEDVARILRRDREAKELEARLLDAKKATSERPWSPSSAPTFKPGELARPSRRPPS